MVEITDTDRINAIGEQGFSVVQEIEISHYGPVEIWKCFYSTNGVVIGLSLREALDNAILAYRNLNKQTKGVQK